MHLFSPGKFLLTAEYTVLRGALGLAVPTKLGQHLHVQPSNTAGCTWQSKTANGEIWFSATFASNGAILATNQPDVAARLATMLREAQNLNPNFSLNYVDVTAKLDFSPLWGLGSSSTLVALIAQWAEVDALTLFFASQTGSGYDVATAIAKSPILYQLDVGTPKYTPCQFNPPFAKNLFLVYLGKKQRSHKEVAKFSQKIIPHAALAEISEITKKVLYATDFTTFKNLMLAHEKITSNLLNVPTQKEERFANLPFEIKSLGAWGGDFVLAMGNQPDLPQLKAAGFDTIFSWEDLIGTQQTR